MTARFLLRALAAVLALSVAVGVVLFIGEPRADQALERAVAEEPLDVAEAFANAGIIATHACVFGPYTTDDVIASELGFDWAGASEQTGIGSTDGQDLVVAADEDRVVAWAIAPVRICVDRKRRVWLSDAPLMRSRLCPIAGPATCRVCQGGAQPDVDTMGPVSSHGD